MQCEWNESFNEMAMDAVAEVANVLMWWRWWCRPDWWSEWHLRTRLAAHARKRAIGDAIELCKFCWESRSAAFATMPKAYAYNLDCFACLLQQNLRTNASECMRRCDARSWASKISMQRSLEFCEYGSVRIWKRQWREMRVIIQSVRTKNVQTNSECKQEKKGGRITYSEGKVIEMREAEQVRRVEWEDTRAWKKYTR